MLIGGSLYTEVGYTCSLGSLYTEVGYTCSLGVHSILRLGTHAHWGVHSILRLGTHAHSQKTCVWGGF
jgi:hypothetical protein